MTIPHPNPKEFPPEIFRLFDKYVHGIIDRRAFLVEAGRFAIGSLTAAGILDALSPRFAEARKVAPEDPGISAGFVQIDSPQGYGKVRGYLVKPAQPRGKRPVVLVVHENRGLNPHIEDIARRLALEGFIAFAPDALFPLGGYPGDEDKAREMFQKLDQAKTREDFLAAAKYAQALPEGNGNLGAIGFCYGGGMVNFLATRLPGLKAAVPFYGSAPDPSEAPKIKSPLMLHFAGLDDRINAGWPAYEQALKAAHVEYQAYVYPGVQHGFNNDTTPRYDEKAANLAWRRSIDFLQERLKA
jgi:carboxymethylenebutenolidase